MSRRVLTVTVTLLVAAAVGGPVVADPDGAPDPCARGTKWRGHKIDLDVRDATLPEVFRFLADVGRVNVVVADDVAGKVTLRLERVPWDQVLCTVAATKQLRVNRDGTVYLIRRSGSGAGTR
jgi:type IV pilus assembly protein PilQ